MKEERRVGSCDFLGWMKRMSQIFYNLNMVQFYKSKSRKWITFFCHNIPKNNLCSSSSKDKGNKFFIFWAQVGKISNKMLHIMRCDSFYRVGSPLVSSVAELLHIVRIDDMGPAPGITRNSGPQSRKSEPIFYKEITKWQDTSHR